MSTSNGIVVISNWTYTEFTCDNNVLHIKTNARYDEIYRLIEIYAKNNNFSTITIYCFAYIPNFNINLHFCDNDRSYSMDDLIYSLHINEVDNESGTPVYFSGAFFGVILKDENIEHVEYKDNNVINVNDNDLLYFFFESIDEIEFVNYILNMTDKSKLYNEIKTIYKKEILFAILFSKKIATLKNELLKEE